MSSRSKGVMKDELSLVTMEWISSSLECSMALMPARCEAKSPEASVSISLSARAASKMFEVICRKREKYCSSLGIRLKRAMDGFVLRVGLTLKRAENIVERRGVVYTSA